MGATILEVASRVSTPLALAGLVAGVVLVAFLGVLKANLIPPLSNAAGGRVVTRTIYGLIALASLAVILGFIGSRLPEPDTLYRVRVNVLDPQGNSVSEADVQSSVGGEPQRIAGGWEFQIPEEQVPASREVTFRARHENAFRRGQTTFELRKARSPAVEVQLAADVSADIAGVVVDEENRGIAGALVFVVGHDEEAVTTSETGGFRLAAHRADGQQVQLRAQREGYQSVTMWHQAGSTPVTLRLERQGQ
jgi:hypothetical protein